MIVHSFKVKYSEGISDNIILNTPELVAIQYVHATQVRRLRSPSVQSSHSHWWKAPPHTLDLSAPLVAVGGRMIHV